MAKPKICNKCQGTGHDSKSQPTVETKIIHTHDNTTKKMYKTKHLGSGCLKCLGRGVV